MTQPVGAGEATPQLRILVFDERASVGHGLRNLLQGDPAVLAVDWVREPELVEKVIRAGRPDVVLVDASTASTSSSAVISAIGGMPDPPAVVVLVDSPLSSEALKSVEAGAVSVVTLTDSPEDLVDAVKTARREVLRVPASLLRSLLRDASDRHLPAKGGLASLTRREREVLSLLASGHDRHSIAARLYCSPETVRTHIRNVLTKLNAHSTVEAVALAVQLGAEHE